MRTFQYLFYFQHSDLSIVEVKIDVPEDSLPSEKYKWLVVPHDSPVVWGLRFQAMSEAGNKQFRTFAEGELDFDETKATLSLMGREFSFERKQTTEIPKELDERVKKFLNA